MQLPNKISLNLGFTNSVFHNPRIENVDEAVHPGTIAFFIYLMKIILPDRWHNMHQKMEMAKVLLKLSTCASGKWQTNGMYMYNVDDVGKTLYFFVFCEVFLLVNSSLEDLDVLLQQASRNNSSATIEKMKNKIITASGALTR